ncbi:MAG: AraC family transcriptional regulator [Pyramidobacter sp.]|uniref:helix-turn-helix transcriptional regulator n=1 Tax=Pyramidobacter sp. TaxID=1943581 RepID=UPI002A8320E4|nr:AraC family transcriptional regulator [Pyramidobacter sp.]MDY4033447.1 AraC family transcriptional regulator [Pyramidobacter sp.]
MTSRKKLGQGKRVEIQEFYRTAFREGVVTYFEVQSDSAPTKPLLHKNSRFLYVLSGKGTIRIYDKDYAMEPGAVIALLPWEISEIVEVREPLRYYLLIYPFEFLNFIVKNQFNIENEKLDMVTLLYRYGGVRVPERERPRVKALFDEIRREIEPISIATSAARQSWSGLYLTAKLVELVILYLRLAQDQEGRSGGQSRLEEEEESCSPHIFQYMYLNLHRKLTLQDLSRIYFVSEASLSRYIFKVTGLGFYELLQEMKLSKVTFLLLHTDISLVEIADILDYSDISHLSRVFSDQQGIGAQQFRRCYQNNPGVSMVLPAPKAGKIIEYIYRNFAGDLTILDVAERFGTSPKMVNESLVYIVEMNFTNFLNYLRIHEAANLLLRTDQSVTDIAFQVGYNSLRSFNRNFLKWLKVTASEFRERVTEQKDTVDIGHLFRSSREEQS